MIKMARTIKAKIAGLAAGVFALTVATGTAVQAQDAPIEGVATSEVTAIAANDIATQLDALAAAEAVVEEATATETTPATATEAVEAPAAEAAEAPAAAPTVIDVNCTGTQAEIDTCVGATNYTPVAEYLGVPYYAQHNGMGGEAWLAFNVGDQVTAGGVTYTIVEIRQVVTGGDIDQIAGMGADAYLQTCLTDGVHSKVFALQAA